MDYRLEVVRLPAPPPRRSGAFHPRGRCVIAWVGAGAIAFGLYGLVATGQRSSEFGRILVAYGGVFLAGFLAWGALIDRFKPDRDDYIGAARCLAGVAVIMCAPRA